MVDAAISMHYFFCRVTPIFTVSCVTGDNLDLLKKFLNLVPPARSTKDQEKLAQEITEYHVSSAGKCNIVWYHIIIYFYGPSLFTWMKETIKWGHTLKTWCHMNHKQTNVLLKIEGLMPWNLCLNFLTFINFYRLMKLSMFLGPVL